MAIKRKVTFDKLVEVDNDGQKLKNIPNVKNTIILIPFHLPLILYGMFHYGLQSNVRTIMTQGLIGLTLLQLGYDYLIYGHIQQLKSSKKNDKDNKLLLFVSSILAPFIFSVPIFIIIILMGAPLSSHLTETFLLANHLSMIIVNPVIILFKFNFSKLFTVLRILQFDDVKHNAILFSVLVSVISTWCGVIPIPLDWDRPWQNWPITLLIGSYLGYFMGSILSLLQQSLG